VKDQPGSTARPVLRAWLEVDLDVEPIHGLLRPERGAEQLFEGWIGFAEALRRLHGAADQPMGEPPCDRS